MVLNIRKMTNHPLSPEESCYRKEVGEYSGSERIKMVWARGENERAPYG